MRRRLDFLDEVGSTHLMPLTIDFVIAIHIVFFFISFYSAPWNRAQNEKPARITSRRSTKRVRIEDNE